MLILVQFCLLDFNLCQFANPLPTNSSPHLSSLVRRLTIDIAPLKRDPFQDEIQEFNWGHPLLKDEPPVLTARSALLSLIPHFRSLESVECYDLSGESHTSQLAPSRSLMRCLFTHCPKLQKLTRTDWWHDLGCTYSPHLGPTSVGIGVGSETTGLTHLTISVPESYFGVDADGLVGVDEGACRELRALLRASPGLVYLDFYRGRISMGLIFRGRRSGECAGGRRIGGRRKTPSSSGYSASSSSPSLSCSSGPLDLDPIVLPELKTLVLWATFVEEKASELVCDYLSTSAGIFPLLSGLEMVTVRCSREGLYAADQIDGQQLVDAVQTLRDFEVKTITEMQIYDFTRPSPSTEELHGRMVDEKHGKQRDRKSRFRQW